MKDAKVLQKLLRARRMSVDLRVSRNGEHGFGLESGEVPRAIGEYCCAFLASNKPLIFSPGQFSEAKPFVVCITPSIFWAVGWSMLRRRTLKNSFQTIRLNKDIEMGSPETPGPRWVNRFTIAISAILCIWALGESAVHLITPQFDICESTLAIARRSLIPRRLKLDFESMASQSFWFGRRLQTMLTHLELSDYNRTLINWEVDKRIYLGFVLSPVIDSKHDPEMNWRRALWEFFYPRISKQYTADSVAEIVVRELRARVSIDQRFEYPIGIETVWRNQVTSAKGFERIYVAALRSVGVGARLDVAGQTEIWTAGEWRKAPRPSVESWLDETMLKRSGMTNSIGPTRAKNTDRVCEASTGPPLMPASDR
jgi:hypothetical protein